MTNVFQVIEYQAFCENDLKKDFGNRANKFYKELEEFAKNNEIFLGFKNKNTLKAKNYVGMIQTKSGILEILPKCTDLENYQGEKDENLKKINFHQLKQIYKLDIRENEPKNEIKIEKFVNFNYEKNYNFPSKQLLLNLLTTLKNSPFKKSHISSLKTSKMSLFEIFISMFLEELDLIFKKGLKKDYVSIEDNRAFLKGKLLFSENLKHNLIHKERFFTESDEFILDIPPNRLIKSTLEFLKSKTTMHKFKVTKALQMLDNVQLSKNYKKDFEYKISRHFDYYETLLSWCRIFLQKETFTPYKGSNEAFALLFPMEKLFEDYVAHMFKIANEQVKIKTQDKTKFLMSKNDNEDCFLLKPDLYIQDHIIADTKWKILSDSDDKKQYSIAQSDLYQMFAYAAKFKVKEVWLIYPLCGRTLELKEKSKKDEYFFKASDFLNFLESRIKLKILFAPLPFANDFHA
ncbi:McrC family protein [Campylobacter sp. W0014]|uniref:McrC family protein n=1 Tax=Campylobacter sp. W0014 TaxID=2735781 RepID=UPI001ED652F0|nr:McrC family protein [Campylobacter sp. W0014]